MVWHICFKSIHWLISLTIQSVSLNLFMCILLVFTRASRLYGLVSLRMLLLWFLVLEVINHFHEVIASFFKVFLLAVIILSLQEWVSLFSRLLKNSWMNTKVSRIHPNHLGHYILTISIIWTQEACVFMLKWSQHGILSMIFHRMVNSLRFLTSFIVLHSFNWHIFYHFKHLRIKIVSAVVSSLVWSFILYYSNGPFCFIEHHLFLSFLYF